jgi:hypothetical protein
MIIFIPLALVGALVAYDVLHEEAFPPEPPKPMVIDFHHKNGLDTILRTQRHVKM